MVKNLSSRSDGEERPRDGAVDLGSGLRSIQRLNQHITQTTALINQRRSCLLHNRFRPNQQFQPVVSLVAFLQRQLQFEYKVFTTIAILSFVDIGTYAGGRAQQLVFEGTTVVNIVTQAYNIHCKLH